MEDKLILSNMKKIIAIAFAYICSFIYLQSYCQSNKRSKSYIYITSQSIKSEDAGFFSDNPDSLKNDKYFVVVVKGQLTKEHLAYLQTDNDNYIYYKRLKRVTTKDGYTEFYTSRNSSFKLTINKITKTSHYTSMREGQISLVIGKNKSEFKVWGRDQESDKYNKPTYK